MRVVHLSLADYRNYERAEVPLQAGPNLLVGRNGQGKTNLVESLAYLSTLSSHRVSGDQPLIRRGQDSAIVRCLIAHEERELLVEVQLNRSGANRAQVNRAGIRPRELPRYLKTVLFAPEDLALVRGEPGVRRRFIDGFLVQRAPRLAGVLADYDRVLKQRNSLLKSARARGITAAQTDRLGTLDIWDEQLVRLGAEITIARRRALADLAEPLRAAYRAVVEDDHGPTARLESAVLGTAAADGSADSGPTSGEAGTAEPEDDAVPESFARAVRGLRARELDRGVSLIGPHRDDVHLELNGLPAKGYSSHGESWSFALALRLAEAALLRGEDGGDPVLILDDVFAELDRHRRRSLAEAVQDYEQVLITAAVYEDVPVELRAHTVRIAGGRVLEASEADALGGDDGATREPTDAAASEGGDGDD